LLITVPLIRATQLRSAISMFLVCHFQSPRIGLAYYMQCSAQRALVSRPIISVLLFTLRPYNLLKGLIMAGISRH